MRKNLQHVKELDGLRGCAAASVLVLHLFITGRANHHAVTQPIAWRIAVRIADLGAFGVDVFFVLSGFLITSLLFTSREKKSFFHNFYWKRVLRIQPVYLVHLLVTWLLIPGSRGYVFLALLFIVNFDDKFHVQDNGPAWTLSIEEQFYLIWPQIIRRFSIPNIYRICIAVIAFSAGLRTFMLAVTGHAMLRSTWYRFDGLAMGALLACEWMLEGEGATPMVRRFLKIFNSRPCFVVALIYEVGILAGSIHNRASAFILLTTNYLVYCTIRYILYHPGSRSFRWLRSSSLLFLGAISYSMYMYHVFFIYLFDKYLASPIFSWPQFFWRAAFTIAGTFLLCIASLHLMERPVQGLRRYVVHPD
jgi:peptidoglycan/LPS O-acetylase OafA/YrhL